MKIRRRDPKLMLIAGVFSLLAGLLFSWLPGHADMVFRRLLGSAWLLAGIIWLLAWWKSRRREQAG